MSMKNQEKLRNMTPVCLNKNVNDFGFLIDNTNKYWNKACKVE